MRAAKGKKCVSSNMPKLLLFPELKDHGVRYGRRQIDRLEAAGDFPKRVAIGVGRVGWVETEIVAHVDALIAGRSTAMGTLGSAKPVT
jgi:predicted DNA-binding transcriptional regulator AlpA